VNGVQTFGGGPIEIKMTGANGTLTTTPAPRTAASECRRRADLRGRGDRSITLTAGQITNNSIISAGGDLTIAATGPSA